MDYVRVCLGVLPILLALCHPAHGECHCRVKSQCDLHQTTCESGCEAGFTGSQCQYENLLWGHTLEPNRPKLVDGNITDCPNYYKRIHARNIKSAGRVNTLRIRYAAGTWCGCKEWKPCEESQCLDGCYSDYTGPLCKYKYPLFAKVQLKKGKKQLTATEDKSEPGLLLYTFEPNKVTSIELPIQGNVCEVELSYEDQSDSVETTTSMAAFQSSASITTPAKTRGKTGCNVGHYGDRQDCTRCGAGCRGVCNGTDGHCTCKTGWAGTRCNKCEDARYGTNCAGLCSEGCDGTCKSVDGSCTCKPGWWGKTCSSGCSRYKYGIDCKQTCSSGCKSGGCNSSTGECLAGSCKPGWTNTDSLRRCDQQCPDGSYGVNCVSTCSPGCRVSSCDRKTGSCKYDGGYCKPGWRSGYSHPYRCDRCASDKYGIDCKQTCSSGCKSGGCNSSTGECLAGSCKPGWTNKDSLQRCDQECPDGWYGVNCVSSCSSGCRLSPCDRKTGRCTFSNQGYCKLGWTLGSHYRCDTCSRGYYRDGQACKPCGAGCWSTCNAVNGHCTCKVGWKGNFCNNCEDGYYMDKRDCVACGAGCESGTCKDYTGRCSCRPGWKGPRCATPCDVGTYGRGCTEKCNTECKPESCNHTTGDCNHQCEDGWIGPRCEHTCPGGTYGPGCTGKCNTGCKQGSCNHVTGDCNSQCKDGWRGPRCEHKCIDGTYGRGCTLKCNTGCKPWSCHHITGDCNNQCEDGWTGPRCEHTCPGGTYGRDCTEECNAGCKPESCQHVTGDCNNQCKDGWTGSRCEHICSPGAYGENCVLNCSRGCVNQTCDRTTGRCDMCLDGWEHKDQNTSRCDKECDDGRFGEQCNDECSIHCVNAMCHHVNGSCTHGCLDGRSGEYCEVSEAEHQNVNLIAGLVLVLIAVIAVVMCAVIYFREPLRRLREKKTGEDMTNGSSFPMAAREGQGASENGAVYDDDEAIYINVPSSVPVAVSDLKDFVAKKKATKEILVKEYAELPKGLTAIHDKALTQENSPKNRFKGIYPYNHSLVVLKGRSGSTGYINASFIDGPTRGKQYIATQGPLPHTVVDFWEMIWQQNVPVIVMLANITEDGRRRCEPYWPNEPGEDSKTFGPWKITVADSCPLADFTIRTLKMRKGAAEKTVKHVHYMVWPDKDVPDNTMSLVDLRNKVRTFCDFAEGPMVVHCSAGVGRTGTLIALDSLIEDAETRSKVDIYGCVWRLRNFRVSMVQTQSQYVFLHDCILDALCHTVHPTPASFYDNAYKQLKRDSGIAVAYQKLSKCPETDHLSDAARDLENINKNRSEDILPGDKHRAILSTHIAGGTDYINAVIAPSYEKRKAFILTQIPLMSTVVDFWRLVHDYDIRGIVLLENYTDLEAKCGVFWAKNNKPTKFGPFSVGEGKTEKQTGFTMEKISYSLGTEEKDVTVFRSSALPQKSSLPESPSSLLSLIDFLRQWNTGTSPLLVVCRDGATRSGLFCVVASAVQRLLLEKEVALQQTIRSIRFVRKQVIPNREQFEFCFDSVKVYMDSFQEYSNFA